MGMMIMGFDKAVAEMEVGEIVNVHLNPEEAYGEADPNAIITLPLAELPGAEELQVGDQAFLQDMYGRPFRVRVTARDEENITFDANHEMAGKELNFQIELVEIVA
jgi:FKBP-type peptidyl-prolyl cis-trans isomerase 2